MRVCKIGDGAIMPMPCPDLEWQMRYGNPLTHRYSAASIIAAYNYLVTECSQKEIWRRVKIIREQSALIPDK